MFSRVQELATRLLRPSHSQPVAAPLHMHRSPRVTDAPEVNERMRLALESGLMRGLFSQLGEDGTLLWIFEGRKDGFYVDIGCHSPMIYSNTAALHIWHNWRGLNVDIDQRSIDYFKIWRPDDINVLGGVGPHEGKLDAFIFEGGALSTLDPHTAANADLSQLKRDVVPIDVMPLQQLLAKHLPEGQKIDFLNVDVEGLDYDVLVSNDWEVYRPEVVAVESHQFDLSRPDADPTYRFLTSLDYKLVSHTVITSIYRSLR